MPADSNSLSLALYKAISQLLPQGRVILTEHIHEAVLDVVLPAQADRRTEVLAEAANELDRIADETERQVAAYYGASSGIGPGSADMVREAARTVRGMVGEKDSAGGAPTSTPFMPSYECGCREDPNAGPAHKGHAKWCPASKPTPERITQIRQGIGDELTHDELKWLSGAAGRHELHIIGGRGGHWPMRDLPGGVLLLAQYLAATVAVIERVLPDEAEEKTTPHAGAEVTPEFFQPGRTYVASPHTFRCDAITTHPTTGETRALGWISRSGVFPHGHDLDPDDYQLGGWTVQPDQKGSES